MSRISVKTKTFSQYLRLHAKDLSPESHLPAPSSQLKLCIVIPSLAEYERLPQVLDSLDRGSQRLGEAEVIVVVNQADHASAEVGQNNARTWEWLQARPQPLLRLVAMDRFTPGLAFSARGAGVGLARRVGMDLAFQRLLRANHLERSAIACLDADSPVAPGYVDAVLSIFDSDQPPAAGLCEYAHPLPKDEKLRQAIIAYELWLRYFEWGLRLAGSCFSFPAIGSCIVVSPTAYAQAHGMAPRQAAEDFHFLQKVVKVSLPKPLVRIRLAKVFPEARVSQRVLFGTGHGMEKCLELGPESYLQVEPPEFFMDIRQFYSALRPGYQNPETLALNLAPRLQDFFTREKAREILKKLRQNYPAWEQFRPAVQRWLDGLRIIRYVNLQTRQAGKVWILDAFRVLLETGGEQELLRQLPAMPEKEISWERLQAWLESLRQHQGTTLPLF